LVVPQRWGSERKESAGASHYPASLAASNREVERAQRQQCGVGRPKYFQFRNSDDVLYIIFAWKLPEGYNESDVKAITASR
jgi:hypothetical protein